jgi:hypothetical protein
MKRCSSDARSEGQSGDSLGRESVMLREGNRKPSPGLMARLGKSIAKQSEGRAGKKYLPVGGRVRKLRAVEDQSVSVPEEITGKLGRGVARQLAWSPCSQSLHGEAVVARYAQWRPHQPPRWIRVKGREIRRSTRAVGDQAEPPNERGIGREKMTVCHQARAV